MGNAYTAVPDDVHSLYWNPAGLARMPLGGGAVQFMHSEWFRDINYEYAAFAYPFGPHAVALSLYNLSVDGIERRTQDTDLAAGTFDVSDFAYSFSYAHRMSEDFGVGANLKYVRETLDVVKVSAIASTTASARSSTKSIGALCIGWGISTSGSVASPRPTA